MAIFQNPTIRLILAVLWGAFVAGAAGAYPYLNPASFNWPAALAFGLPAFVASLIAHVYVSKVEARFNTINASLSGTMARQRDQRPGDMNY
jgi:hypothetical protein